MNHSFDVNGQTGLQKGWKYLAIRFDSFRQFTRALNQFAVVCHTSTETGYFISQKTKRVLDEVDIYLQSAVGNKISKCLLTFENLLKN